MILLSYIIYIIMSEEDERLFFCLADIDRLVEYLHYDGTKKNEEY